MTKPVRDGVAIVAGVGSGLGGAVARRFAREGLTVVLLSRKRENLEAIAGPIREAGGTAIVQPTDLRDLDAIDAAFAAADEAGPLAAAVFNAGAQYRAGALETDEAMFEKVWRLGTLAGFAFAKRAAARMLAEGHGTLLFTGATASLRGAAHFGAFAAAKAGLRAMAQSLAKELGPQGVHVGHVVVDGVIDSPAVRRRFPGAVEALPPDGVLAPDAIADAYWHLHAQSRSAWTFEMDLRPWAERF